MEDIPEEAVIAAAQALFQHSIVPTWDDEAKALRWLQSAEQYRTMARDALIAALPYLSPTEPKRGRWRGWGRHRAD